VGIALVERALALAGADSANGLAATTEPAERPSR